MRNRLEIFPKYSDPKYSEDKYSGTPYLIIAFILVIRNIKHGKMHVITPGESKINP